MTVIALVKKIYDYFFAPMPYVSDLEKFIISKKPTNTVELDHWMKVWDHNQRVKSKLISQGKYNPHGYWD